jgi:hypothetical protein
MDIRLYLSGHWIPAFAGMTAKNPFQFVTPAEAGVQERRSHRDTPCPFNYGPIDKYLFAFV